MEAEWQSAPFVVVNLIQEHFEKDFTSVQCVGTEDILDVVDTVITGEMNRKLLRPVTFEEVRKATFNL